MCPMISFVNDVERVEGSEDHVQPQLPQMWSSKLNYRPSNLDMIIIYDLNIPLDL